jgi:HlyD family secretion protein
MNRLLLTLGLGCAILCGCHGAREDEAPRVHLKPAVSVVRPEVRNIVRIVEQPGIVQPYEKTAIYTKITGYVKKWYVDIGDRVKKDDRLLDLYVPELVAEHKQKQSQVELDRANVVQMEKYIQVTLSNLDAAKAYVEEAKFNVKRFEADVARWESEYKRDLEMIKGDVLNKQVLDETEKQLKSSMAGVGQAKSAVLTKIAQKESAAAAVDKARADLEAAKAKVEVSISDENRIAAMLSYTTVTAPYPAIVTARNINTGDFVLPTSGDPTRGMEAPGQSASHATPLFMLDRSDILMFVVGVPEIDAPYVHAGAKASLRIQALSGKQIDTAVTRTSWSLNNTSRTLRAEIDLFQPDPNLRPGMYAYGSIVIERPKVQALPLSTIIEIGNQPCCYCVIDGKAVRTPVQTGVTDGTWIEVSKKRLPSSSAASTPWVDFVGDEVVIAGGTLSELFDGQAVTIKK